MFKIVIKNENIVLDIREETQLLSALQQAGVVPDAPCGGHGTCGKCKVLVDGVPMLACQTTVDRDMTVELCNADSISVLVDQQQWNVIADGTADFAFAFDIGTTSIVGYLLDGHSGKVCSQVSCLNPQISYGADVISRLQYAKSHPGVLTNCIRQALAELVFRAAQQAEMDPQNISVFSVAGNTAMHHLLLGIDPDSLTTPPYMPSVFEALTMPAKEILPVSENATLRVLPNVAGFVGGDTVACMTALKFDQLDDLSLLIDIGTNGEIVLGDRNGILTCSTAAGPALEGGRIQCGMRAADGAVDRVWLENGQMKWHVIGEGNATGICGSGLMDLVSVLLELGRINRSGRLDEEFQFPGTPVVLTKKDVRQLQLAKSAIRSGIELLCRKRGVTEEEIRCVYLAGAFGNYLNPVSACRIGLLPPALIDRIQGIGNAAGAGAIMCAVRLEDNSYAQILAYKADFLELASESDFQDHFIDNLNF